MITLTETTDNLQVVLGGNVTTNQMRCFASWRDYSPSTYLPGRNIVNTNNTTDVNLVAAPATGEKREVQLLSIYNSDTAPQTLVVKFDANGTEYTLWSGVLNTAEKLEYISGRGFKVSASGGAEKFVQSSNTPASNTLNRLVLATDVINNNGVANTLQDVTGLTFSMVAGNTYYFRATIPYNAAATTTGSRWTVNGPASPTFLSYTSKYTITATTETANYATAYSIPAASNATSLTTGNIAVIEGVIRPSADGTFAVQFASEILSSAITAKAGALLEYIQVI